MWTDRQQTAFDALKACLISAPILGFPTEDGRFVLDTDASLFAVGGVLHQLQDDREVVIAYASRSLRLSQRRYCMTRREMLAAVVMCTHFRSYLRGAQFSLRTDHSSLRWLQKFRNEDGMLARWYLLLGQFSVTFEYRPGAQHANADGMSQQCGQCQRPDCPVSSSDSQVAELDTSSALLDQPFASSEMGDSMDADLLPELSGETWVAATLLEGLTVDLLPAGSDLDLIVASRQDTTLATVYEWVQSGEILTWSDCAGLSPELRCWRLKIGNMSVDTEGRLWRRRESPSGVSQLIVPHRERQDMIHRFHDSLFAGHLGVSRTVYRLQTYGRRLFVRMFRALRWTHVCSMRPDVDWYIGTVCIKIHFLTQRSGGGGCILVYCPSWFGRWPSLNLHSSGFPFPRRGRRLARYQPIVFRVARRLRNCRFHVRYHLPVVSRCWGMLRRRCVRRIVVRRS